MTYRPFYNHKIIDPGLSDAYMLVEGLFCGVRRAGIEDPCAYEKVIHGVAATIQDNANGRNYVTPTRFKAIVNHWFPKSCVNLGVADPGHEVTDKMLDEAIKFLMKANIFIYPLPGMADLDKAFTSWAGNVRQQWQAVIRHRKEVEVLLGTDSTRVYFPAQEASMHHEVETKYWDLPRLRNTSNTRAFLEINGIKYREYAGRDAEVLPNGVDAGRHALAAFIKAAQNGDYNDDTSSEKFIQKILYFREYFKVDLDQTTGHLAIVCTVPEFEDVVYDDAFFANRYGKTNWFIAFKEICTAVGLRCAEVD